MIYNTTSLILIHTETRQFIPKIIGSRYKSIVRLVFKFILRVFFRSVSVINRQAIPKDAPVIIVGNHNNQFVDGFSLIAKTSRPISFLIAQKSYNKPIIGDVAKCLHTVPVTRPQDLAMVGVGRVTKVAKDEEEGVLLVHGNEECNKFERFPFIKGAKIRIKGVGELTCVGKPENGVLKVRGDKVIEISPGGLEWQCLPKVDQNVVFNKVIEALKKNGVVGVFPEGGSHDQGRLIPLKAGVAIMALGAASQGTDVKIVPAGLTYLNAHKFRSKAFIEFGTPFSCPRDLVERYKTDSRGACSELLELIKKRLEEVTINTENYETRKLLDVRQAKRK